MSRPRHRITSERRHPDAGITEREMEPGLAPSRSFSLHLPSWETIAKTAVLAFLIVFFSLLQTSIFARWRPFGAVPDLMLPLTVAVAIRLGERWGAVFGIAAAFVVESLGGGSLCLLPLLYMPVGYFVGALTEEYLSTGLPVRILLTLGAIALRSIFTIITVLSTSGGLTLGSLFSTAVFPEFLSTLVFAAVPHLVAVLCLKPFPRK